MTDASSSTTSPPHGSSTQQNPNHPALPPLTTSTPSRRNTLPRPMSHASRSRLSQYSIGSATSKSRPGSHMFPSFQFSLLSTKVRDFAYPAAHPMHLGPPPEPSRPSSGLTTPTSESRRLSDPPAPWEQRMPWDSWTADGFNPGHEVPPIEMGDGPPYSEDEDLQSPVVATRHRKQKSSSATSLGQSKTQAHAQDQAGRGGDIMAISTYDSERGYFVGTSGDGSERYYVTQGGEANGPGGEYVTYPPEQARHGRGYHYSQPPPQEPYREDGASPASSPEYRHVDESRYSRDYQFTITSPDEEFHGKAVALFDFERENENELPLVEGQIIWVSYRHGQGWLVAEDPKTQESGLVPEEYVRLLRDIEGGMNSLTGNVRDGSLSPNEADTPTQIEQSGKDRQSLTTSTNGYHQPVVSVFSTSSKDLNPYPTEQLGIQAGQPPPQVVHYHGQRGGSQTSTPTIPQLNDAASPRRRGSQGSANDSKGEDTPTQERKDLEASQTAPS